MALHWLDYVLFALVVLGSIAIGLYNAIKGKTPDDTGANSYLMDRHKLSYGPVMLSIVMSFMSSIALISSPNEVYFYGTQIIMVTFANNLGIIISCYIFVPMIYQLEITSVFQYHDLRFGSKLLRILASIQKTLSLLFWGGACVYAPSVAMAAVARLPIWVGIVSTAIVGTIYTTVGGFQAVIWTDSFQALIYIFGVLFVMVMGVIKAGGLFQVFHTSSDGGRLSLFHMDLDPTERTTFWSTFLPVFTNALTYVLGDQMTLQRIQSCKSERHAKLAIWLSTPLNVILEVMLMICGLTIYAYYDQLGCDPYENGQIANKDEILPYFVGHVLTWPGTTGLFIALLISGSLSTISSIINSCSALTWSDIVSPCMPNIASNRQLHIVKMLSVFYGAVITLIAFLVASVDMNLFQVVSSWIRSTTAPLDGLLFLGAAFACAQWKGAVIGLFCSVALTLWITIGRYLNPISHPILETDISQCPTTNISLMYDTLQNETISGTDLSNDDGFILYQMSFLWIPAIGWCTTIIVGLIASFVTCPQNWSTLDPRLLIPWGRYSSVFKNLPNKANRYDANEANGIEMDGMLKEKPYSGKDSHSTLTISQQHLKAQYPEEVCGLVEIGKNHV